MKHESFLVISFADLTFNRQQDVKDLIRDRIVDDFITDKGKNWRTELKKEEELEDDRALEEFLDELVGAEVTNNWQCKASF